MSSKPNQPDPPPTPEATPPREEASSSSSSLDQLLGSSTAAFPMNQGDDLLASVLNQGIDALSPTLTLPPDLLAPLADTREASEEPVEEEASEVHVAEERIASEVHVAEEKVASEEPVGGEESDDATQVELPTLSSRHNPSADAWEQASPSTSPSPLPAVMRTLEYPPPPPEYASSEEMVRYTPLPHGIAPDDDATGEQPQLNPPHFPDGLWFSGSFEDLAALSAPVAFQTFRPIPEDEPSHLPASPSTPRSTAFQHLSELERWEESRSSAEATSARTSPLPQGLHPAPPEASATSTPARRASSSEAEATTAQEATKAPDRPAGVWIPKVQSKSPLMTTAQMDLSPAPPNNRPAGESLLEETRASSSRHDTPQGSRRTMGILLLLITALSLGLWYLLTHSV